MAFDVMVDGRLETLALSEVNGFLRIAKETVAARLYLDDDERVFILCNDVEVVVTRFPVSLQNLLAFLLQVLSGEVLAPFA